MELLAPPEKSRLDLAQALADAYGGTVHRFFHPQSEPSKVPGMPVFHNLTLGYRVLDGKGRWLASCVDDLTLQSDLVKKTPSLPGWYRILSDDERLLRLIQEQADPEAPMEEVLEPVARLFGTEPTPGPGGMVKVDDRSGASVAIAAPLPGERHRPCELVTAPLEHPGVEELEELLSLARGLGFTAPIEGATHLHFEGSELRSAPALARLVAILSTHGEDLKALMGTNPRCRRLGRWPQELSELVAEPPFSELGWEQATERVLQLKLIKYCDFNLLNYLLDRPGANTVEIRVLPVWLEAEPIVRAANLFVAVLKRALDPTPLNGESLLGSLPLEEAERDYWLAKDSGQ